MYREYIDANKERFVNELCDLLRIPSVSADPSFKKDVLRMAEATRDALSAAGADEARLMETDGYPIVFAQKIIDPGLPTVLVYGHYDVQPPDPLNLWESGPFEPVIKKTSIHPDGAIFARGSCDDKGQVFMHVKALEVMLKLNSLPCNVKFMIEGEEEVGSSSLGAFLEKNKELLKADVILISDTSILANDLPSVDVGLRGLSYVEVEVTGPNKDLHSGVYGGAVANPAQVLCEMIASLKDKNNHIVIPGFYDDVYELTASERAEMADTPFDSEVYKRDLDVNELRGEEGYSTLERTGIRPTLEVNGMWGGYTGEGAKTVLPSKAYAKISMRLVPYQDPDKITKLFSDYFCSIAPPYVKVQVKPHHGGHPYITKTDSIEFKAASRAMEKTFGKKPIPTRGGGSIPIVALFEKTLGLKSVLMGFGLDSDGLHSPNEHYGIFNFLKGIETIPHFFHEYTQLKKQ